MSLEDVRVTTAVAKVLREFLEDPAQPRYGFDLMHATGLASGSLYVILARLQRARVLEAEQEDIDPVAVGRPARRLYRLTAEGAEFARIELAALSERLRPPAGLRPVRPRLQRVSMIATLVLSLVMTVFGGLVFEEVKGRLDRLCFAMLNAAAKRLPSEDVADLYEECWLPELHYILRNSEGMPITRLINGCRYAFRIWFAARHIADELTGTTRRGLRRRFSRFWNESPEFTIGDMIASSAMFCILPSVLLTTHHGSTVRYVGVAGWLTYMFAISLTRQRWGERYGRKDKKRHATRIEVIASVCLIWPALLAAAIYIAISDLVAVVAGHGSVSAWVGMAYAFFFAIPAPFRLRTEIRIARKLRTSAFQTPGPS